MSQKHRATDKENVRSQGGMSHILLYRHSVFPIFCDNHNAWLFRYGTACNVFQRVKFSHQPFYTIIGRRHTHHYFCHRSIDI